MAAPVLPLSPPVAEVYQQPLPPPATTPWALIAALAAAVAAAGYGLRRWFSPKLALKCGMETSEPQFKAISMPLVTAPQLQLLVDFEVAAPSAPRGLMIVT